MGATVRQARRLEDRTTDQPFWRFSHQGAITLRQVTADYTTIAIKQGVGEAVNVSVNAPEVGRQVHQPLSRNANAPTSTTDSGRDDRRALDP